MGIAINDKVLEEPRDEAYCEIRALSSWCWVGHGVLWETPSFIQGQECPRNSNWHYESEEQSNFEKIPCEQEFCLVQFCLWTQDTVSIHIINITVDHHYIPVPASY